MQIKGLDLTIQNFDILLIMDVLTLIFIFKRLHENIIYLDY